MKKRFWTFVLTQYARIALFVMFYLDYDRIAQEVAKRTLDLWCPCSKCLAQRSFASPHLNEEATKH